MERSIDELIELLNDKDDFVVEDAIGELELRADEAVDSLIDALSSRKKGIRLHAATLLGAINDPKAIPALVETLHDNNKLVRREASTALSRMGEPAVDPLIETLSDRVAAHEKGLYSEGCFEFACWTSGRETMIYYKEGR